MLIEIHAIQNHSPANLNRDDLGAPKTCYFGGVLRSRISSQCLKRSIRTSDEFKTLCGGIRTRQLAKKIAEQIPDVKKARERAEKILEQCGFKSKKKKGEEEQDDKSKMLIYTTYAAIKEMAELIKNNEGKPEGKLAEQFGAIISKHVSVPDMALSGRMLEPDASAKEIWKNNETTVEAALQVAHAISTHAARPEVDYYVAKDDVPGEDAGAGFLDEAMFASACFYKYFSIHWEKLVENLKGNQELAAHTIGAFLRGVAKITPTGKQNSYAANNYPDGLLVEIKKTPVSYANAFAKPVEEGQRGIIEQSIAQLAQYAHDLDVGFGNPEHRFWFSPNLRYPLMLVEDGTEKAMTENNIKSLDELIAVIVRALGHDWQSVQKTVTSMEPTL